MSIVDMSFKAQMSRMEACCFRDRSFGHQTWEIIFAFIRDNEYDEETLTIDINEDYDESSIIDQVCDDLKRNSDEKFRKKLHTALKNACMGKPNVNKRKNFDPMGIRSQITVAEVSKYRALISQLCPHLSCADQNQDLMKVMRIGAKNHIPLLTLLFDTFSRVRVDKFADSLPPSAGHSSSGGSGNSSSNNNNSSSSSGGRRKPDIINVEDFKKQYPFYKKLLAKNKPKFVEILHQSTKTFGKRLFPKLVFGALHKIDDDMEAYARYVIQTRKFVHFLVNDDSGYIPFQVDLVIIPANVVSTLRTSDEHKSYAQENDPEPPGEQFSEFYAQEEPLDIGNIRERLVLNMQHGWAYEEINANLNTEDLYRSMFELYTSKLLPNYINRNSSGSGSGGSSNANQPSYHNIRRHKRLVVVIDRRKPMPPPRKAIESTALKASSARGAPSASDDPMFLILAPSSLSDLDVRHLIFEQSLSFSKTLIMPPVVGNEDCLNLEELLKNKNCIGCTTDCNGYFFAISFICHSSDIIRGYWFINGSGTRFFPQDVTRLWPSFFTDHQVRKFQVKLKEDNHLKDGIKSMKFPDPVFEAWYASTTGRLVKNTH